MKKKKYMTNKNLVKNLSVFKNLNFKYKKVYYDLKVFFYNY